MLLSLAGILALLFSLFRPAKLASEAEFAFASVDSTPPTAISVAAAPSPLPTDPASPTPEPTQPALLGDPIELTAIALESATPAPTGDLTETVTVTPTHTPAPAKSPTPAPPILYYTQAGDTLPVLAIRFGVTAEEIRGMNPEADIPETALLRPDMLLLIPTRLSTDELSNPIHLMPDSEVVYSPSAVGFDVEAFVAGQGGYLSTYREYLGTTGWTSGAAIIQRVATENSINPRLLLALLEYRAHWVTGQPSTLAETYYPMGHLSRDRRELFSQLNWAVDQLSIGYYGWRQGQLTTIAFADGRSIRLDPHLNAGTVAVMYLFAQIDSQEVWAGGLYDSTHSLTVTYTKLFGDPQELARPVEPLLPVTLTQPALQLPFLQRQLWSLTGGPHFAWNRAGAWAALDFAPGSTESGCVKSNAWVAAAATGLVVRSGNGIVVTDLDGDGREQTGWVILYLHLATEGRVAAGEWVEAGQAIGHPSCEGGLATGTHLHIARKYNGEWVLADGPLPFNLDGWVAHAGQNPYEGYLSRGDEIVKACTCSSRETYIQRDPQ